MKIFVLAVAVLMYALVIIFTRRKSFISLGAALIILIAGAVSVSEAFVTFINWNVLLIYVGSLIIAELFIYSRVPSYLADKVVDKTPNLGLGIVLVLVMTGVLSAFVENVATVLVMAPIALELCRRLKISPAPFLMGLAVMANLQGTATLVGDPPSMIFAGFAGYSFNDFFIYQGRLSIFFAVEIGAVVGAAYFYFYFRKLGKVHIDLPVEKIVSLVPSILLIVMVLGLAVISFLFKGFSLLSGVLCFALGIFGLLWYVFIRREPFKAAVRLVKGLDWDTILFLIGIFIVLGAISKVGLLDDLSGFLKGLIGQNLLLGFVIIVGISVVLSG
ncbi:MAG: citrate transporter, partial [Spirochaetales bacterium]